MDEDVSPTPDGSASLQLCGEGLSQVEVSVSILAALKTLSSFGFFDLGSPLHAGDPISIHISHLAEASSSGTSSIAALDDVLRSEPSFANAPLTVEVVALVITPPAEPSGATAPELKGANAHEVQADSSERALVLVATPPKGLVGVHDKSIS
ncbi:hypothetical protein AMTR_s00037p00238350 [Amborella trichopoda]|uniref:Uncharacterized protein n=1 Tax=Amborella trichopoda TaxID=13333 RepID=U5D5D7_AMBTC|nr:hypothetical protein AMTR_s00037p00238350 [Amborella trichopoda]